MRQIEKRLRKLKKAIRPDDDIFTFEELCRSMWRTDKEAFRRPPSDKPGVFIIVSSPGKPDEIREMPAVSPNRRRRPWLGSSEREDD